MENLPKLDKHLTKKKPRKNAANLRKKATNAKKKANARKKAEPVKNPALPKKSLGLEEWPDVISEKAHLIDISKLSDNDLRHVLRLFDLNPEYGPFVGINRLSRWKQAEEWGMHPPTIIKDILENRPDLSCEGELGNFVILPREGS